MKNKHSNKAAGTKKADRIPNKPKHLYEVALIMSTEGTRSEITRHRIVSETRTSYIVGDKLKGARTFSKQGIGKRLKTISSQEYRYSGYVLNESQLPELIEFLQTSAILDLKQLLLKIQKTLRHAGRWEWDQMVME